MKYESIENPDMQLAKLLIARKLKDAGVDIAPSRIMTSMKDADLHSPPVRFRYPLRGMTLTIQSIVSCRGDLAYTDLLGLVDEQVADYQRVSSEFPYLEAELAEAKTIAKREIAKARRRGMATRLLEVRPSTIQAGGGWLPVPDVQVEILSEGLVPERFSIVADEIADISEALTEERLVKRQTIRAVRKAWLDGIGAAGGIDVVALAALTKRGHDAPEAIRRMRESRNGMMLGTADDGMHLSWDDGLIDVDVSISDGVSYKAGELLIEPARMPHGAGDLRGRPVDAILTSDLLHGAVIRETHTRFDKHVVTLEPRYVVYDAATLQPREQLFPM